MIALREHVASRALNILRNLEARPYAFKLTKDSLALSSEEFQEILRELEGEHGHFDTEREALPTQKLIRRQTIILEKADGSH